MPIKSKAKFVIVMYIGKQRTVLSEHKADKKKKLLATRDRLRYMAKKSSTPYRKHFEIERVR